MFRRLTDLTGAKDVIPRCPECSGQPGDAVSAKKQVEVKEAPERLHLPEEDSPENTKIETTEKLGFC